MKFLRHAIWKSLLESTKQPKQDGNVEEERRMLETFLGMLLGTGTERKPSLSKRETVLVNELTQLIDTNSLNLLRPYNHDPGYCPALAGSDDS